MKRRIFQFGDQFNNLFVFPPYEEEEDYSFDVEPKVYQKTFDDGSYRVQDVSPKKERTISKRFIIRDKNLNDLNSYIDYIYRVIGSGVQKLYMITDKGDVRYTYAEVTTAPYQERFTDNQPWKAFTINFLQHDPYWYEAKGSDYFVLEDIRLEQLIIADVDITDRGYFYSNMNGVESLKNRNITCEDNFILVKDSSLSLIVPESYCSGLSTNCYIDPSIQYDYKSSITNTDNFNISINKGIGGIYPTILIQAQTTAPSIVGQIIFKNLTNGTSVDIVIKLNEGEYYQIDLNSSTGTENALYEEKGSYRGQPVVALSNKLRLDIGVNNLEWSTLSGDALVQINYTNKFL